MPLASSRCIRTALASCGFKLKNNDELSDESTIKGVICRDKLEKLNDVTTKVMLLWLNIMEIGPPEGGGAMVRKAALTGGDTEAWKMQ
ncbi:hypothetical protein RJ639_021436 [Escallonia herrerae]|uniref:Uncharacterized protein n=1 Tax=Escallonia herrerae TaxID=1293975 RepID=A0AA89AG25_9ASTE|nr:hypothetical protein RJ639_021436 [Escallonia herrerae]